MTDNINAEPVADYLPDFTAMATNLCEMNSALETSLGNSSNDSINSRSKKIFMKKLRAFVRFIHRKLGWIDTSVKWKIVLMTMIVYCYIMLLIAHMENVHGREMMVNDCMFVSE